MKKLLTTLLFIALTSTANATVDFSTFNPFTGNFDATQNISVIENELDSLATTYLQSSITYDIIVGTITDEVGVDFYAYESSTFTAEIALQAAIDSAQTGQSIFVKTGTYVWSSSITVDVEKLTINFNGSTWTPDDNRPSQYVTTVPETIFIGLEAENILIDNLFVSGKDQRMAAIWMNANADFWKVHNTRFFECGAFSGTHDKCIAPDTGADYGECFNVQFIECLSTNIMRPIAAYGRYINILQKGCNTGANIVAGDHTQYSNLQIEDKGSLTFSGVSHFSTVTGFSIESGTADAIRILNGINNVTIANGTIKTNNSTGIEIGGSNNSVTNVSIEDITNLDAIEIGGDGNSVTNCTFSGTIDDYCIDLLSGAENNTISNCVADDVSGNLAFLRDGSGNETNQYANMLAGGDLNYANITIEDTVFRGSVTANGQFTASKATPTFASVDIDLISNSGSILMQPSGDTDDYLTFTSSNNAPTLSVVGAGNLKILNDHATLSTVEVARPGNKYIRFGQRDDGTSFFLTTGTLDIAPSLDVNDFFQFSTVGDVPTIGTSGSSNLKITASGGTIDFDDEILTTSGQISSNSRKLVDEYSFVVVVTSPSVLGNNRPVRISPYRDFATTITTFTAICSDGTSVTFQVDQRAWSSTANPYNTEGTLVFSGAIVSDNVGYKGGAFSDATLPANYALFIPTTSWAVSGNVGRFDVHIEYTKD